VTATKGDEMEMARIRDERNGDEARERLAVTRNWEMEDWKDLWTSLTDLCWGERERAGF